MSQNCNFPPYGLPFPSPKLHQDAKKKKSKEKYNFWPKQKCKKKNAKNTRTYREISLAFFFTLFLHFFFAFFFHFLHCILKGFRLHSPHLGVDRCWGVKCIWGVSTTRGDTQEYLNNSQSLKGIENKTKIHLHFGLFLSIFVYPPILSHMAFLIFGSPAPTLPCTRLERKSFCIFLPMGKKTFLWLTSSSALHYLPAVRRGSICPDADGAVLGGRSGGPTRLYATHGRGERGGWA